MFEEEKKIPGDFKPTCILKTKQVIHVMFSISKINFKQTFPKLLPKNLAKSKRISGIFLDLLQNSPSFNLQSQLPVLVHSF